MPAMQAWQTCRAPFVWSCTPVGLRLAALAAVVACALAAPVPLQPEADGGRNGPASPRAGVELNPSPTLAGPANRSRCSAVLRDSAVLRRSLSRLSDSLAASEARAVTFERKFRASKRRADRLVRENTELRARLEAVPATVRSLAGIAPAINLQPVAAGSVKATTHTTTRTAEPGRKPPPLLISGARLHAQRCVSSAWAVLQSCSSSSHTAWTVADCPVA
jgi:hypothetical protein